MTLSGKVALVTGGTSGIGFHTAVGLARLGAIVHVTGRDASRGSDAQRQIRASAGHDGVYFIDADASTVGANQDLAAAIMAHTERLDILVNNVGGNFNDRVVTEDGYEATLAVNVIGPFALTEALLPALRAAPSARIVNLASAAISMWRGDPFEDLHSERRFLGASAYARAKLFTVLWTFALAARLAGTRIVANTLHPGLSWTPMTAGTRARQMPPWMRIAWPLLRLMQRAGSAQRAARTPIYLASSPEAATVTGTYFDSDGHPGRVPPVVLDRDIQERAWAQLARLVACAPTARNLIEVTL